MVEYSFPRKEQGFLFAFRLDEKMRNYARRMDVKCFSNEHVIGQNLCRKPYRSIRQENEEKLTGHVALLCFPQDLEEGVEPGSESGRRLT